MDSACAFDIFSFARKSAVAEVMNAESYKENHLTLLNLLNVEENTVEKILKSAILITGSTGCPTIASDSKNLLNRTNQAGLCADEKNHQ